MQPQSHSREHGTALVLVTLFMVTLFGFAALSIDVGNTLLQRIKIHEASDAAALAAVVEWASTKDSAQTIAVGRGYCHANNVKTGEILSIEPGQWIHSTRTFVPESVLTSAMVPAVRVTSRRTVDMYFAKVVGTHQMHPRVQSIAVAAKATSSLTALPWAVCDTFVPAKCMTITLQFKSGGEENACSDSGPLQGNMGQLSFPGRSGASDYEEDIVNGYQGKLSLGCTTGTRTDPGGSWGPTRQGIDARLGGLPPYNCTANSLPPDNARLAIMPRVATLDLKGKKDVCITGFMVVSLDGYDNSSKSVTATFIESYEGTEIDPNAAPKAGELAGIALVQ